MSFTQFVLATLWLQAVSAIAVSANVYFLPGDLYYHTYLSEGVLSKLNPGKHEFYYIRPQRYQPVLGEYIGVRRLQLNVNEAQIEGLRDAYTEIRSYEPKVVELGDVEREVNPPHLFIYHVAFYPEIEARPIFMKCNKNWVEQQVAFDVNLGRAKLEEFLPSRITESWKYSSGSDELKIAVSVGSQDENRKLAWRGECQHKWFGIVISHNAFKRVQQGEDLTYGGEELARPISATVILDGQAQEIEIVNGRAKFVHD